MGSNVLSKLTKKIIRLFIVNENNKKSIIMVKAGFMLNSEQAITVHNNETINNIHKETASIFNISKCSFKQIISLLLKLFKK